MNRKKQESSLMGVEPKASCHCGQDVRQSGAFTPRTPTHPAHTGLRSPAQRAGRTAFHLQTTFLIKPNLSFVDLRIM